MHDEHAGQTANPLKVPTLVALAVLGLLVLVPLFIDLHGHEHGSDTQLEQQFEQAAEGLDDFSSPGDDGHAEDAQGVPPLWLLGTVPFVALLLCIALLPLIPRTAHWWESNMNRLAVAMAAGGATLVYYVFAEGWQGAVLAVEHAIPGEYIPFIVLLFSLYVISGGISITGDLRATPEVNTAFIATGTLIASFIGTTGASMLLIRPLLETNRDRKRVVHTVIFFIFLVSNIGGSLLPIGDPPLFLGYLRGVPFTWTLGLWPQWLFTSLLLLAIYYIWDRIAVSREAPLDLVRDATSKTPLRLRGWSNLLLLGGVVFAVALLDPSKPLPGTDWRPFPFMREVVMMGLAGVSVLITPSGVREANRFNYHAIAEVAALFIGIFVSMQVPLVVLKANGASLGLENPTQFYWLTGALSSFLDNAPTYLVFFQTASAMTPGPAAEGIIALGGAEGGFIREDLLAGISIGAVFMGANTYIGNGPNFMVKSIAEQSGVAMPSFFGYFARALVILVPVLILVNLLFL